MATLQKFKHLATQCAVAAGSPTRSPTTSPVVHLRRRKTLRMLLNRTSAAASPRRSPFCDDYSTESKQIPRDLPRQSKNMSSSARHKLKDLFVSSPPPLEARLSDRSGGDAGERLLPPNPRGGASRRGRVGALRPLSAAFRSRLLRRAWRPMLVTIPE